MGTLATGITTAFATWAKRSGTAGQIGETELGKAAGLAATLVIAYLGADVDDTDNLAVAIGFMEALRWLTVHASLKLSAGAKDWITEMETRRDDEIARRKQAEWLPHQKTRDRPTDTISDKDLFPFS